MQSKLAFEPNKVSKLKPLHDTILVCDMSFDERITNGGIYLLSDDMKSSGIRPRWAKVYAIGPEQQDVKVGQYILVNHGRWSRGIDIENSEGKKTIRKVDPKDILLVSDKPVHDDTISDKAL
jgi:co-chaperonin GroES (HSP10)